MIEVGLHLRPARSLERNGAEPRTHRHFLGVFVSRG